MNSIADIHCHVLPYVDDGAEHSAEMEELLVSSAKQNVRVLCLTPHFRSGMFTSEDETVLHRFEQAKTFVEDRRLPLKLYLGREYYCDRTFLERLEMRTVIPLGEGNTLLVEFSSRYDTETILKYLEHVQQAGYRPLVAHVERYPAISGDTDQVERLIAAGAMVQVNAGSLLGREGHRQKAFGWKLVKQGLVDVVASDCHDPSYRPPELGECARKIESKAGKETAQRVLWDTPMKILGIK